MHRRPSAAVPAAILEQNKELRAKQQQDLTCFFETNSNKLPEAKLEHKLLTTAPVSLKGFPYLYKREYVTEGGMGDLVFTNGQGLYAVVEVKYINLRGANVTQKRRKVKKQATKYGKAFRAQRPDAVIVLAGYYTEEDQEVQWVVLADQDLEYVHQIAEAAACAIGNTRLPAASVAEIVAPLSNQAHVPVIPRPAAHAVAESNTMVADNAGSMLGTVVAYVLGVIAVAGSAYFASRKVTRYRSADGA